MRRVLLFSGGYDSTCLLAELCEEALKDGSEICCVTIQHNLTGVEKLNRESAAQEAILNELTSRYPYVNISHEVIKIESNWNVGSTYENKGLAQPIFWACNLIPLLNSDDYVYFGYIQGDQAPAVKQHIVDMIQAGCKIQDDKKIKVLFPYEYFTKDQVLKILFDKYPYLVELCTSCEGMHSDHSACGRCVPCTHLKQALVGMIVSNDYSKYEQRAARKLLRKLFGINVRVENLNRCKEGEVFP